MKVLLSHLGLGGLAALAIIVAAGSFQVGVQEPLEEELRALERSVGSIRGRTPKTNANTPSSQMGGFYRFFEHPISAHEWLAKLHGIGRASGVELPSADYRVTPTGTPITRYQLTLPISSTYSQARAFMANALNEIPVLSVDQASFRRTRADDPRLEVEIVMTLHLLEP